MDEGTVSLPFINDSLRKKIKSTKKIAGLDYRHSHNSEKIRDHTVWLFQVIGFSIIHCRKTSNSTL